MNLPRQHWSYWFLAWWHHCSYHWGVDRPGAWPKHCLRTHCLPAGELAAEQGLHWGCGQGLLVTPHLALLPWSSWPGRVYHAAPAGFARVVLVDPVVACFVLVVVHLQ